MIKCPMPGCGVVISPERGTDKIAEQETALLNHLRGIGASTWHGCKGHDIDDTRAKEIARAARALAELVEKVL